MKCSTTRANVWHERAGPTSRRGPGDEIGTPGFVTPADVAHAATLADKGKVFSPAPEFGSIWPQEGWGGASTRSARYSPPA